MSEQRHRAYRVVRRIPERQAGATLIMDGDLPAQPGQFVMVWLPGVEERPLAVVSTAPLALTVCRVGPFTHAMCNLAPGDRLFVRGPFGHGFPIEGGRHLLVGGGSGIASLGLLASRLLERGDEVHVAIGARTAAMLMLCWRFKELGCTISVATDDGSEGYHGSVVEAILPQLEAGWPEAVYGCGPEPMLEILANRAALSELPCWLSLERIMRCGIGVCGSCHCGPHLVCLHGPVFAGQEVLRAKTRE